MRNKLLTLVMVFVLLPLVLPISSFGKSINYSTDSYESIIQKSKSQNKYFFVKFTARWCTTCKVMDENANNNSTLVNYINKNFLAVKADMDNLNGQKWKEQFNVCCLPTLIVFSPDGHELGRKEGGIPSSEFLSFLENAFEKKATLITNTFSSNLQSQFVRYTPKGKTIKNNSKWTIIFGIHTHLKEANTEIESLKQKMNQPILLNAKRENNIMIYQVSIGNIKDEQDALQIMKKLHSMDIQCSLRKE